MRKLFFTISILALVSLVSCAKENQKSIDGQWEVLFINNQRILNNPPNFVINLRTLKIAGFAGCNQFFGSIEMDEKDLQLNGIGSTRALCPDMTIEESFLNVLRDVTSFTFEANVLVLNTENKDISMKLKPLDTP